MHSFLHCLFSEIFLFVMALGGQYASFQVTKVQYGGWRYQQMVVFLCHVGLIPREA